MADAQLFFRDRLSRVKNTVKVLILGDYSIKNDYDGPDDTCEKKLEGLQTHLKEKGFKETRLVKDFKDEEEIPQEFIDEHFIKKSEHYIEHWADILLFIYLIEGDNQSVVREWSHLIKMCSDKCNNSILLHHKEVVLRALLRGDIKGHQITHDQFEDTDTLHSRAFQLCFVKLYNFL